MAYRFAGGVTGDGLSVLSGLSALEVPAGAVSLALWVRRNGSQDQFDRIANKEYDNASSSPFVSYGLEFSTSNNVLFEVGTSGTLSTTSVVALADATWTHFCGTFDRTLSTRLILYKNGASSGSATGVDANIVYSGTGNQFNVGTRYATGNNSQIDVAEIAIWDVALSAAEAAALGAGYSPALIRPGSCIFYVPAIRSAIDVVGGLPITVGGTTPAAPVEHPRIIMPRRRMAGTFAGTSPPPPPPSVTYPQLERGIRGLARGITLGRAA